jgi:AcrR family transcriptional regulator
MSSSGSSRTRADVLDAARRLLERAGGAPVPLDAVARAAGISRQALYLHFPSRARLLMALVRHVDDVHGLTTLLAAACARPSGPEALRRFIAVWGDYVRHISGIARAMQHLAATDPDAAAAWQERMRAFRRLCKTLTARLAAEHRLAAGWTPDTAADLLATLLSIRVWRELVRERRWPIARYVTLMTRTAEQTLVKEPT